jgi:hypothetical protein
MEKTRSTHADFAIIGAAGRGVEHDALLAVEADALALEIRRGERQSGTDRKARPWWRTTRALTTTRRVGLKSRLRLNAALPRPSRTGRKRRIGRLGAGAAGPALRAAFSTCATKLLGLELR